MFEREFNYIVAFSFIGLGSFVFGLDLLWFGFGPVFYQLSYSPFSKFDKLRFHESGIESICSSNKRFVTNLSSREFCQLNEEKGGELMVLYFLLS